MHLDHVVLSWIAYAPNRGWTGIRYRVVLNYSVLSGDYKQA